MKLKPGYFKPSLKTGGALDIYTQQKSVIETPFKNVVTVLYLYDLYEGDVPRTKSKSLCSSRKSDILVTGTMRVTNLREKGIITSKEERYSRVEFTVEKSLRKRRVEWIS